MDLNNKVAVITGAASGIGKQIAQAFLAHRGRVAIADMNLAAAQAAARELDPGGERAIAVAMDVTNEEQVERFGRVGVLVNNAGIGYFATVEETGEEQARRLMDVNPWASGS